MGTSLRNQQMGDYGYGYGGGEYDRERGYNNKYGGGYGGYGGGGYEGGYGPPSPQAHAPPPPLPREEIGEVSQSIIKEVVKLKLQVERLQRRLHQYEANGGRPASSKARSRSRSKHHR